LARAAAGHLDERIVVEETDALADIERSLNTMMVNMERMSHAKNDFLSNMSHEIRTPMSAIIGMTEIAKNAEDRERIDFCLQKIEDNSKHLIGVINDILDFSKIESGKLLLEDELFSLSKDMDFIIEMFRSKVEEKNITLNLSLKNIRHDGIFSDALRLNQVLINLISNAVKFTDAGGRIDLEVGEIMYLNGESVYSFSVSDTGIGIEPEQAKKLFTAFVQANAGTTKKYGGTGLGLVISKSIVEKMGGEIDLESTPGEGSTFSFTIRVNSQESADGADSGNNEDYTPDLSDKHLLIVDDIEINLIIALELLKETGIEMETAADGKEAFDKYMQSPVGYYDMIFMDMQMPVMNGCDSTVAIRNSGREDAESIKIVAVTANVMRDDVKRAYDAGMNAHVGKPIDFNEAYRVMGSLLR
ncbi:MAG: response regulator, partial [Clostridiales Family XIII bacterium]|nr:response regulator [Clostridiales Family XIII bacterium]